MGMGGSAMHPNAPSPPVLGLSRLQASLSNTRKSLPRISLPPVLTRVRVAIFIAAWFVSSLSSLFVAKHVLHTYPISETQLTLSLFASSVVYGLFMTQVLRLHPLARLSRQQLRAIVPLSTAFLIKEVLKYASLARVSVNLVNTIRSLGPLFNVLIEYVVFRHRPQASILWALCPIIAGVALTTVDEFHSASDSSSSLLVALVGFSAAVVSTGINNCQNIYSKVLFGKERIDPVSLQIYLSAISLALISPPAIASTAFTAFTGTPEQRAAIIPPTPALVAVAAAGLVNFTASQLAFNTLNLISPLSYSVANTFKRVCIAVIAIVYFSERLSPVNGLGILISIGGLFLYERKSRALKQMKAYRRDPSTSSQSDGNSSTSTSITNLSSSTSTNEEDNTIVLSKAKLASSSPDSVRLDVARASRLEARRSHPLADMSPVLASPQKETPHASQL